MCPWGALDTNMGAIHCTNYIRKSCNLEELLLDVDESSVTREGDKYVHKRFQCQTYISYCAANSGFIEVFWGIQKHATCKESQCYADHLWDSESMAPCCPVLYVWTQQPTQISDAITWESVPLSLGRLFHAWMLVWVLKLPHQLHHPTKGKPLWIGNTQIFSLYILHIDLVTDLIETTFATSWAISYLINCNKI